RIKIPAHIITDLIASINYDVFILGIILLMMPHTPLAGLRALLLRATAFSMTTGCIGSLKDCSRTGSKVRGGVCDAVLSGVDLSCLLFFCRLLLSFLDPGRSGREAFLLFRDEVLFCFDELLLAEGFFFFGVDSWTVS